jgi:hypothetical protein
MTFPTNKGSLSPDISLVLIAGRAIGSLVVTNLAKERSQISHRKSDIG